MIASNLRLLPLLSTGPIVFSLGDSFADTEKDGVDTFIHAYVLLNIYRKT